MGERQREISFKPLEYIRNYITKLRWKRFGRFKAIGKNAKGGQYRSRQGVRPVSQLNLFIDMLRYNYRQGCLYYSRPSSTP